jgi:hypothetical protein
MTFDARNSIIARWKNDQKELLTVTSESITLTMAAIFTAIG